MRSAQMRVDRSTKVVITGAIIHSIEPIRYVNEGSSPRVPAPVALVTEGFFGRSLFRGPSRVWHPETITRTILYKNSLLKKSAKVTCFIPLQKYNKMRGLNARMGRNLAGKYGNFKHNLGCYSSKHRPIL